LQFFDGSKFVLRPPITLRYNRADESPGQTTPTDKCSASIGAPDRRNEKRFIPFSIWRRKIDVPNLPNL
jgi:hypothetical protein